jgi:hypothetical protein
LRFFKHNYFFNFKENREIYAKISNFYTDSSSNVIFSKKNFRKNYNLNEKKIIPKNYENDFIEAIFEKIKNTKKIVSNYGSS